MHPYSEVAAGRDRGGGGEGGGGGGGLRVCCAVGYHCAFSFLRTCTF